MKKNFLSTVLCVAALTATAADDVRSRFDVPLTGSVTARYVKINMTKLSNPTYNESDIYYQLAEVEVMSGGVNVALNCDVAADTLAWDLEAYGWAPKFLTDGIIGGSTNGYTTEPMQEKGEQPAYVIIDLGEESKTVDAIVMYPRQDSPQADMCHAANFPASFTVEYSTDGENYTTLFTAEDMTPPYFTLTGHEADFSTWLNVQGASQLTNGCRIKMKEYNGTRFYGTCNQFPAANGNFVTGSTEGQTPFLTITDSSDEDGSVLLQDAETQLYWGGHGNWRGLIAWSTEPDRWVFDFAEGKAKLRNTATNYSAFCDGGAESGIATDVAQENATELRVMMAYDSEAAEVGSELTCIISALHTGAYELITLPYDVASWPSDYGFYEVVERSEDAITVKTAQSIVAGTQYLMRYEGTKTPETSALSLTCTVAETPGTYTHELLPWEVEVVLTDTPDNVEVATGAYTPDWDNLAAWQCPEWFKDAKFGIWAHWGPQCQAEDGDWYGRNMYFEGSDQYNWHVEHYGSPSTYGFKDLCNDWKAENWDPEQLVALYKSVGARYFFTLGQHHDNFDLWDSPYQEWNSVNIGPKRDMVKEWSDACKQNGLPFGVSMHGSHAWTWFEIAQGYDGNLTKADGEGKWWEGFDPQELYAQNHTPSSNYTNQTAIWGQWEWGNGASQPNERYKTKFQNRVLQCVNDYRPDLLYFDDTVLPFYGCDESVGLNILAHTYNTIAEPVVTGKGLSEQHKQAMLWDVERGVPDRIQQEYWQTCTCIGDWHYSQSVYENNGYKGAQQIIDMLVDIVSKNGNMLLSVPIKGDGTIDEKEKAVLTDIKAWMDQNSRSIYGTRPWKTFGEGPLAEASNPLTTQGFNEGNNYSADDVRYAIKYARNEQETDTLFATILRWPDSDEFTFESLGLASPYFGGNVSSIQLLGYEGDITQSLGYEGLTVCLPDTPVNAIAPVFAITFSNETSQADLNALIDVAQEMAASAIVREGTGYYSEQAVTTLYEAIEEAQNTSEEATEEETSTAYETLREAISLFRTEGKIKGGQAEDNEEAVNLTIQMLGEDKDFTRTADTDGPRFGTPQYWSVENFYIPNGDDGVKNGIDRYTGSNALMMGVWDDRQNAQGDMTDARIYQTVTLKAGRYFFGAAYQVIHQLYNAYIFASNATVPTAEMESNTLAYDKITNAAQDGNIYGIWFNLSEEQPVVLGFQADMQQGATQQEFRATAVTLLGYDIQDTPVNVNSVLKSQPDHMLYDLTGRHVAAPAHGVYISNGKTIFVK